MNLDDAAAALGLGRKPTDWHTWGQVEKIEADGAYSVRLNGAVETTRCAAGCTAAVGDRVLVCCMANGRCAATARLGGDAPPSSLTLDSLKFNVGGRVREPLRMGVGDASGDGVIVGAGGRVIVGAGESAQTMVDMGIKHNVEELNLAADGSAFVLTNLNTGWDERKTFAFGANGVLTAPGGFQSGGVVDVFSNKLLWKGASYMNASQSAKLSEAVSKQPHGIVLVWSHYQAGSGQGEYDWQAHFVPKWMVAEWPGKGWQFILLNEWNNLNRSYLYINDTVITGYKENGATGVSMHGGTSVDQRYLCLRYVIGV